MYFHELNLRLLNRQTQFLWERQNFCFSITMSQDWIWLHSIWNVGLIFMKCLSSMVGMTFQKFLTWLRPQTTASECKITWQWFICKCLGGVKWLYMSRCVEYSN